MNKAYIQKDISLPVVEVNKLKGIVTLYASAFDNVDSDGDIITKGAYAKTISEGQKRIKHLFMHKTQDIIGRPLRMIEDSTGLLIESFITEADNGDHRLKYAEGLYTEHSVGIIPLQINKNQDGTQTFTEVKLFEYSTVTWGANPNTPTVNVKNQADIYERLAKLEKFLRNSTATDETLYQIELEIKQIQSLLTNEPRQHSKEAEPVTIPNLLTLYNSL